MYDDPNTLRIDESYVKQLRTVSTEKNQEGYGGMILAPTKVAIMQ